MVDDRPPGVRFRRSKLVSRHPADAGVADSALQHAHLPEKLYSVFAGQDAEATQQARSYFTGYPPSSPSIALLRDGKLIYLLQRNQIENRDAAAIAADLTHAFDQFCVKSPAS